MKRTTLRILLVTMIFCVGCQTVANRVYDRVLPATVSIVDPYLGITWGSGVIIDFEKGHIITACHVIDGCKDITIRTYDGCIFPAVVVIKDPSEDLAVLEVNPKDILFLRSPKLNICNEDELSVGETIFILGSPASIPNTLSKGILSRKRTCLKHFIDLDNIKDFFIADASVTFGNSGCVVLNSKSRLVGIVVGKFGSYTIIIPCTRIKNFLDRV